MLYTVGYKLSGTLTWELGHSAESTSGYDHNGNYWGGYHTKNTSAPDFLKEYIATEKSGKHEYAYTTSDTTELQKIFKSLAGDVGALYSIQPSKIVDVIDARFKLTDEQKKEFDKNDEITYEENNDGTTTITWTGSSAHIGNKNSTDNTNKPWSATVDVVAKDDFIGGNAVPTNTGTSGIYITDTDVRHFDKPTVNVKLLSMEMTGKEITVYKGDPVNSSEFYSELAKTLTIKKLGKGETLTAVQPVINGKVTLPNLEAAQLATLNGNKTLVLGIDQIDQSYKYTYPGTTDAVGYFTYTYKISDNPGGNASNHTAGDPGTPAEQYTLEVTFIPYTVNERTTANGTSTPAANGGTVVSQNLTASADYKVNIIAGSIEITKILDVDKNQNVPAGTTFTFHVDGPDNFSKNIVLTVSHDESTGQYKVTYTGDELKNLARGAYTVSEVATDNYQVKDNPIIGKGTNTWYTEDPIGTITKTYSGNATITKYDLQKNNKLEGAQFVVYRKNANNKKEYAVIGNGGWITGQWIEETEDGKVPEGLGQALTTSDVAGDAYGTVTVKGLKVGDYFFQEVVAPDGYSISTNDTAFKMIETKDAKNVVTGVVAENPQNIFMVDTQISQLPSTGGIGTTIFTIAGCLIMIAAAGLFFASRKKSDNK